MMGWNGTALNSRRQFLKNASMTVAAAAMPGLLRATSGEPVHENATVVEGKDGMIVRSVRFLDLEMPPEYATSWITPVRHFFVRNHMFEPAGVNAGEWKVSVS